MPRLRRSRPHSPLGRSLWNSLGIRAIQAACLLGPAAGLSAAADGPGIPNLAYAGNQVGARLSIVDPRKAVSAISLHRGYVFVPLSQDHGGGMGEGAFAFYDYSNPASPFPVLDSRDDPALYHTFGTPNYVGDWAEMHHLSVSDDLYVISERRNGSAGFCLFDTGPLYDSDPTTKPRILSHFSYDGVTSSTDYDGYSFAPMWQGKRYLYAPTGAQGLYIVDTTDLTHPVQLNHLSRAALGNITLRAAWPIGNLLILSQADLESTFEARIYDISDPANPLQIGSFSGPAGYHAFIYGSAYYNAASPIYRFDFRNPSQVVATNLYPNPSMEEPEYGFGKDGFIYIGESPGGTKWKLNGDKVDPVLPRMSSGIDDDHGFINPLGNLLMLCSDHVNNRRMILSVSGTDRDILPPDPMFSSPADGAVSQNVLSRVGICFSDIVDPQSVNTSTLQIRNIATNQLVAGTYSSMMSIVNFVPDAPLDVDATYDITLIAGGVKDQAGNAVPADVRVARFSTGGHLNDYKVVIQPTTPVETGSNVNFSIAVTKPDALQLEHSWTFGDGSAPTAFSQATSASHTYTTAGNFSVLVKTRIAGQTYAPGISGVQVVHLPIPATAPVNHTTIAVDPSRPVVWNVNPDNDSVSQINTDTLAKISEIPVGVHPTGLTFGPQDTLWVVNKGSDELKVIQRSTGVVSATWKLPLHSEPAGIVADVANGFVYVSLEAFGQVVKISSASGQVVGTLAVGSTPRGLSLDPVRHDLWVSRFISPDEGGQVRRIHLDSFTADPPVTLPAIDQPDGLQNGRGIPNYIAALAISPDDSQGYLPSKKDNIGRGLVRDGLPLTFDHTVRSMATNLRLDTGAVNPAKALDFDNSDFATAAVFSPLGNVVFLATSGTTAIWAVDAFNPASSYSFLSGGQAPDGLAVSADGSRLYVHNFMDRSVTVFRSSVACGSVCGTAPQIARISTVTTEKLAPQVLRGKQLFYNTLDSRMAMEGYMSCASCHDNGGHDGRVWDFTNLGEGLRNTIDLNGHGTGHGPSHWSGNFDEFQDFEGQIRTLARGYGLMSDELFLQGNRSDPLGQNKAGLSPDLDALAAYLGSLSKTGISPARLSDDSLTASALAGREIFRQENCARCHGGTSFTDSESLIRHDVGTLKATSGFRLGRPLDGLDTPTLRGLWKSAPYLHDGSAKTLREVLVDRDLSGRHVNLFHRTPSEIDQLVEYLRSIDDLETTAPVSSSLPQPALQGPGTVASPLSRYFSLQLSASGGGPFTWQALSLPPGMEIDPVTGLIQGTPSVVGRYTVKVSARNEQGASSSMSLVWDVADPLAYRFIRLESLSSHNGQTFSSLAEINLLDIDGKPLEQRTFAMTASTAETEGESDGPGRAADGDTSTFWHSRWLRDVPPFPHQLTVGLTPSQEVYGFTVLPRQDGNTNGRIKDYNLYGSVDGVAWQKIISMGQFADSIGLQTAALPGEIHRVPVFAASQPTLQVVENSQTGILIGRVNATNPGTVKTLTFRLGAGNIDGAFSIDSSTGDIYVAGPVDYEKTPLYRLQVIVTGEGSDPLSASIVVPVSVANVIESNDEAVLVGLTSPGGPFAGQGNPSLIDFAADPDHDGIPNALELLLGTDPHVANAPLPVTLGQEAIAGKTYTTYEYRISSASRLQCHCLVSSDMTGWQEMANAPVLVQTVNGVSTYRVRDSLETGASPARFMRIELRSADSPVAR